MKPVATDPRLLTAAILLAAASAFAAHAQTAAPADAGWQELVRDSATASSSTVTLPVGIERRFRAMTICAEGGTVHLRRVEVRLDGRVWQRLEVPPVLQAGQCGDAVDLRGGNRRIHAVRFEYDDGSGPAATVVARARGR